MRLCKQGKSDLLLLQNICENYALILNAKLLSVKQVLLVVYSHKLREKNFIDEESVCRARNNFRIVSGHDDRPNSFLLGHVSFLAGQMYMMNFSFRDP